ncbi:serine O-acetyltransferase [Psychroflexus sp. MBR-150]
MKYKKYGGNFFSILFFTQGFWALIQYRFANYIYTSKLPVFFKKMILFFCLIWQKWIEILTGISIPASVNIGQSFYIGHFGNIIINSKCIIGDNCNISQGVTLGVSGQGEKRGTPTLGNNIYIGANVVIAGKINIGNNVIIGANSLVNKSIPNNSIAIGVPAKVVKEIDKNAYL